MKPVKRSRLIAAGMSGCSKDWRAAVRLLSLLVLIQNAPAQAGDVAAPTQKAGDHSTVATSDGEIRDDELVEFICQKIKDNGGKVKDVKLMANSCYGGGDDMERVFGPAGACPGIPWVGGSASAPEQAAQGWSPAVVQQYSADKLGSPHTIQKLDGGSKQNLLDAIATAVRRLDENAQLVIYLDDHGGSSLSTVMH